MELAGYNMDGFRHEKQHQGSERWERQSCLAEVLGLIGKGKLFTPTQPKNTFHFIKEQ